MTDLSENRLGPSLAAVDTDALVHAGGDGDYVLVHTWIEGHMSDLAVFTGPVGDATRLRPGRTGLAPCVWEAAVLAHERDALTRHVSG